MQDKQRVIEHIWEAFHDTERPADAFLQGSHECCEPGKSVAPFIAVADWSQLDPAILDANNNALSFLSEGGFRYFLPAYLIADLQDRLQTADPLFHLTNGFSDKVIKIPAGQRTCEKTIGKSAFVNPRRYGAMTWQDHARCRLSVFTREEAGAIVAIWNTNGTRISIDSIDSMRMKSMPHSIASGGTELRTDPRITKSDSISRKRPNISKISGEGQYRESESPCPG